MKDNIFISQRNYTKSIVKKFGIEKASHKRSHAATHVKLSIDDNGVDVDQSLHKSMIGSLLYHTTSRHDITFSVGVCARYQVKPKVGQLTQVKRIMKYINGTCDYGILYSHDNYSIIAWYYDVDWDGSVDDRKRTYGGCFFLGNNLISWFSKKHNCVSLSNTEAKYIVGGSC
ncbi:secreted RxLR effector protein 161-like [Lathyrus oleraceus]|uniref:secreted RxLR effector protein 161-like n=1 Tax=Pisum sativum TaxID=3888 RepID=UPI0021CFED33|nr:secreted RxLR effector protein 161-like [Pisum sativum]